MIGLERGDEFAIGGLPMNVCVEIGKRSSECVVKTPCSSLVGSTIRLRCVVDEVIGKQFFEQRALVLPRTTVGITEASAGHHRQTMTERDDEPRQRRGILVGGQVTQHCFPVGQARRAGA